MPESAASQPQPSRARLSAGLVLTIVLVAFEGLAVSTIMPVTAIALHGLRLYSWTFSGFMLGALVGTIAVGDYADREGPSRPFALALLVFSLGLIVCGFATTMPVFIAGRVIEGLGTGALRSMVWLTLNRGFGAGDHARMGALLSSAWVVPSLVGPALAGVIAHLWSWRAVYLALLPLVPLTLWIILRPLAQVAAERRASGARPIGAAIQLGIGVAVFLSGLEQSAALPALVLIVAGSALALPALHRTLPPGTLGFRRGLPAVLGVRGLLTFAYFGAVAFFPLALEVVRGLTPTVAGVVLSVGSLGWTGGSWTAAWLDYRYGAGARPRVLLCGTLLMAAGIVGAASVLWPGCPLAIIFVSWTLAGLGMGISFNIDNLLSIQTPTEHSAGVVSSSMQLTDSLGQALGAGFGGGAMAVARWAALGTAAGIALTFALSVAICALTMWLSPRLAETPIAGAASAVEL
jgi:MFS family permease